MDEGMHPLMQVLDLSFNYFGREDDLQPLIELPRLVQVLLYVFCSTMFFLPFLFVICLSRSSSACLHSLT
jgi:hypothetical protein